MYLPRTFLRTSVTEPLALIDADPDFWTNSDNSPNFFTAAIDDYGTIYGLRNYNTLNAQNILDFLGERFTIPAFPQIIPSSGKRSDLNTTKQVTNTQLYSTTSGFVQIVV